MWCMPAWCTRKSLGKYNFRSILGYFLPQWNWEHGRWGKKKEEHLIFVYFTAEGKERAAAAVIPESHFRLAFCCQNHSASQPHGAFHLRPSKKSADSNNHSLGNVDRYYSEFSCEATLKRIWLQAEPEQLCFPHINYKAIFRIMEKWI